MVQPILAMGVLVGAISVAALLLILFIVRRVNRKTLVVGEDPRFWLERELHCPGCGESMAEGYVMAGKGVIWRPRAEQGPGIFAHIGQALENTMSFGLPPALNMAWRCESCELIMLDLSKMVRRG